MWATDEPRCSTVDIRFTVGSICASPEMVIVWRARAWVGSTNRDFDGVMVQEENFCVFWFCYLNCGFPCALFVFEIVIETKSQALRCEDLQIL